MGLLSPWLSPEFGGTVSRSLALIAHFGGLSTVTEHHGDSSNVAKGPPPFAICVQCSIPPAKRGIFPSNVFSFVTASISSYTVPRMLPPRLPKGKIPLSAMQRHSLSFLTTPECCSPSLNTITVTSERIKYY